MTYKFKETHLDKEVVRMFHPSGYKMLISLAEVEEKSRGGVILPDALKGKEGSATLVAKVLKQGPDCYKDKVKFPSGPWCEEGDTIFIRAYAGTRFDFEKTEYRLINDDTVEGVIHGDPARIERAF